MSLLRLTQMDLAKLRRVAQAARQALNGAALALALLAVGCATDVPAPPADTDAAIYEGGTIQIGDQVKAVFPGAPNLNFAQIIQVDGMLNLGQPGSIKAEGKTADDIEKELLEIYGPDLIIKEVNVTVESMGFPVFVSGAVLRPGKVMVNRSVTVLEAIMEAGGFDATRANLRAVQVIRQEDGKQRTFVIDVKTALAQAESRPFHLRPSDVVYVPEKFFYF